MSRSQVNINFSVTNINYKTHLTHLAFCSSPWVRVQCVLAYVPAPAFLGLPWSCLSLESNREASSSRLPDPISALLAPAPTLVAWTMIAKLPISWETAHWQCQSQPSPLYTWNWIGRNWQELNKPRNSPDAVLAREQGAVPPFSRYFCFCLKVCFPPLLNPPKFSLPLPPYTLLPFSVL